MAKVMGKGSIVQLEKDKPKNKCRKWQLRVPAGMDLRTGKYKVRTRRVSGNYTKAKLDLRSFIQEVEGDHVQGRTDYTFKSYCQHYLDTRSAKKEVAPTTQRRQGWQSSSKRSHRFCSMKCTSR